MTDSRPIDLREHLRRDHEAALAEVRALRGERDAVRCHLRLDRLRRSWMIHALAEEAVAWRALEGAPAAASSAAAAGADERFADHRRVEGLFDALSRLRPGGSAWHARLEELAGTIARHAEDAPLARLAARFDAAHLRELGRQYGLARDKLALLEEAKAA